ncbi:hypothetical protein MJO28_001290 [Puccinia striiformis f. sp. tritici]|uniref:Uncharacterized protein n=1 Tax=Puccinia striiformis f. sp. tritici TaxID=168172 RepID=A0ACC0EUN1_9BASI|nr:hypothetical protein Pst134EA_003449 [Puccinia striiformis f. sp. tritici]KAH9472849.1 hypothetical protein Pst134EA_003449 [Puccinia striiformis f. sp. tritici]KAI7960801.1 hypothetical protein MJO28_001290 [Puccinia striiformis f. sp. tritici]
MADLESSDDLEIYQSSSSVESGSSINSWTSEELRTRELVVTTGSTLRLLDKLISKFKNLDMTNSDPIKDLPQEIVDKKNEELIDLETNILPSYKLKLRSLHDTLGLQNDSRVQPKTNLESTYRALLDLHKTWDILYDRIETTAWDPPSEVTQDHHYGQAKFFRTDLLAHDHWKLSSPDTSELLSYYKTYIRSWQQSVHRPAIKSKSQFTYTNGQTIITQTDHCLKLVDKMIHSFQLSDLDLLQLQWISNRPTLEKLIKTLTQKAHIKSVNQFGESIILMIGLAGKIIPLLKLIRTLMTKISNPYDKSRFGLSLSPVLSSYTLQRLEEPVGSISSDLELLIEFVSHPIDRNVELTNHQINEIRSLIINQISEELNNFLIILALNLIPSDCQPVHHSLQLNYQDWILTWKSAWDLALSNVLDTVSQLAEIAQIRI